MWSTRICIFSLTIYTEIYWNVVEYIGIQWELLESIRICPFSLASIWHASIQVYGSINSVKSLKRGRCWNGQIIPQCEQWLGTFFNQRKAVRWGTYHICNMIPNDCQEHYKNRWSSMVFHDLLMRLNHAS